MAEQKKYIAAMDIGVMIITTLTIQLSLQLNYGSKEMELNKIYQGDCLEVLKNFPNNSIDAIVTDPPAGIGFMGKEWDSDKGGKTQWVDWLSSVMVEGLRVLKPGGHALVWALPRTSHWTGTALENAGFEVRDCVYHLFGSGFPKSLNIGKAIEKINRGNRVVDLINGLLEQGFTMTELGEKSGIPALESSYRDWTTGGHNPEERSWDRLLKGLGFSEEDGLAIINRKTVQLGGGNSYSFREGDKRDYEIKTVEINNEWEGWGTALKPAVECWWLVRKPLGEKTVAENVLKHGTGGINIDESRIGTEERETWSSGGANYKVSNPEPWQETKHKVQGRFPANLIHDGSDVILAEFAKADTHKAGNIKESEITKGESMFGIGGIGKRNPKIENDNGGSPARFFYTAKPSSAEKNLLYGEFEEKKTELNSGGIGRKISVEKRLANGDGINAPTAKNFHPTVKAQSLMQYLIKLITPPKGIVLDMFAGSGSTLLAAKSLGHPYIGIEISSDYCAIAEARLKQGTLDF